MLWPQRMKTLRIHFVRIITIRGQYLFFIYENASFQGYFTEVSFDTSEENQLSYFQNAYFFQNYLVIDIKSHHNQVTMQMKRKNIFLNFSLVKILNTHFLFHFRSVYIFVHPAQCPPAKTASLQMYSIYQGPLRGHP